MTKFPMARIAKLVAAVREKPNASTRRAFLGFPRSHRVRDPRESGTSAMAPGHAWFWYLAWLVIPDKDQFSQRLQMRVVHNGPTYGVLPAQFGPIRSHKLASAVAPRLGTKKKKNGTADTRLRRDLSSLNQLVHFRRSVSMEQSYIRSGQATP